MKSIASLILGLGLGIGLATGCTKQATPITPPPVSVPTGAPFTLVELKFYLGDDVGLQLQPDGRVEENAAQPGSAPEWKLVGKLSTDGKFFAADGQEVGAVQADGTIKSAKGEIAPFKFEGDAIVIEGGKRFTLDDKGVLQGAPEMPKPLRVEGITDAGSRRAALFIVMLTTGGGAPPTPDDGTSAPPVPPPG